MSLMVRTGKTSWLGSDERSFAEHWFVPEWHTCFQKRVRFFKTGLPVKEAAKDLRSFLRLSGIRLRPLYPLRRHPFSLETSQAFGGCGRRGEPGFPPSIRKPVSPR